MHRGKCYKTVLETDGVPVTGGPPMLMSNAVYFSWRSSLIQLFINLKIGGLPETGTSGVSRTVIRGLSGPNSEMLCTNIFFPEYKLYRNGMLTSTVTSPNNFTWTIGPHINQLTFGKHPGGGGYTSGAVDELSIFHAVLSDNDINNLYNAYWNN